MAKKITITNEMLETIYESASKGLTNDQIADQIGIGATTFYDKINKYPDFSKTLKEGRASGIEQVTNALFGSALDGNTTSMIFFLKNRAGWTDKQTIDIEAKIEVKQGMGAFYDEIEGKQ